MTLAVIGEFARTPKFQGAGSSQVNATQVDNALDGIRGAAGEHLQISFSPGFLLSGEEDSALLAEACLGGCGGRYRRRVPRAAGRG